MLSVGFSDRADAHIKDFVLNISSARHGIYRSLPRPGMDVCFPVQLYCVAGLHTRRLLHLIYFMRLEFAVPLFSPHDDC